MQETGASGWEGFGGYGDYIIACYAIALLLLLGLTMMSYSARKKLQRRLNDLESKASNNS